MKLTQVAVLCVTLFISITVRGQSQETVRGVVVDKMVATVNGELVTYSDVVWQLALQPGSVLDNPSSQILERALGLVINQRLIMQEAEKLPSIAPTDQEVESELTALIKQFPSQAEFEQRALRVGLNADRLREIVRRRVRVEKYLEFRFRAFVVITAKEVADYYRDVWVPRLRQRSPGRIVPTLEESRGEIERTLTEAKIESDIANFLDAARERAEIAILSPL